MDLTQRFLALPQHGKVQAEYVWMDSDYFDGKSFDLCSKTLTLEKAVSSVDDLPVWHYGGDAGVDIKLVPRKFYRDPFRPGDNILVLADTYDEPLTGSEKECGHPAHFNSRAACAQVMKRAAEMGDDPWFGIEQEYYLLDADNNLPLGWPDATSRPMGPGETFYCSVGATKCVGRDIVEAHYRACLYAGIKIGGTNSEDEPAQWEYQVGPCSGIDCADDLWMSRYILQRICELYGVAVSFHPKPMPGRAGSGCHTNYSTVSTRQSPGGYKAIVEQIGNLQARSVEHMKLYGEGNECRLTGNDHTASMSDFSYGVGDRGSSIRINAKVVSQDCGYYEDRRPAANMDPYLVMGTIVETTILDDNPKPLCFPDGKKARIGDPICRHPNLLPKMATDFTVADMIAMAKGTKVDAGAANINSKVAKDLESAVSNALLEAVKPFLEIDMV